MESQVKIHSIVSGDSVLRHLQGDSGPTLVIGNTMREVNWHYPRLKAAFPEAQLHKASLNMPNLRERLCGLHSLLILVLPGTDQSHLRRALKHLQCDITLANVQET